MSYLVELVKNCESQHVILSENDIPSFFDSLRPDMPIPIGLWRLHPYQGPERLYLSFRWTQDGVSVWRVEDQYSNRRMCA